MRKRTFLFVICALAIITGSHLNRGLKAQEPQKRPNGSEPDHVPIQSPDLITVDLGGRRLPHTSVTDFAIMMVKGAPFSADIVMETTPFPGDDDRHGVFASITKIYRDSEGRTRFETSLQQPPRVFRGEEYKHTAIQIHDLVGKQYYNLIPHSRTAQTGPFSPPPHIRIDPILWNQESKQESLGKQEISGIESEGTRSIKTLPADSWGNKGNDPIEIICERWYSPELQVVTLVKLIDPDFGETVCKLTNISRSEPDPSLFQVPPNYTIEVQPKRKAPAR